jgi:hypothetical protein
MCHQVDLSNHAFATTHAGILFPADSGYVYVEKCGGTGPFVRLDFRDKNELVSWLEWKFANYDRHRWSKFFVTFNGDKIEEM